MTRRNEKEIEAWDRHLSRTYGATKALFTLAETCEILDISIPTLYKEIGDGKLAVCRMQSSPRITRLSIIECLAGKKPAPTHRQDACATEKRPEQQQLF